jgi:hypothetical protein
MALILMPTGPKAFSTDPVPSRSKFETPHSKPRGMRSLQQFKSIIPL